MSPDQGTPGNGLLLFFRVDDFDLALERARSLVTRLEEEPHVNPNTQTQEFRCEIRTDITLRSVRSPRPDKALLLPSAGRGRRLATFGTRPRVVFQILSTGKIMPVRAKHSGCTF